MSYSERLDLVWAWTWPILQVTVTLFGFLCGIFWILSLAACLLKKLGEWAWAKQRQIEAKKFEKEHPGLVYYEPPNFAEAWKNYEKSKGLQPATEDP